MTLTEIKRMLDVTGLPVTERAWPEGKAPPLPFICYLVDPDGSDNFAADGVVYCAIDELQVELYTKYRDPNTEAKVEEALASHFWQKTVTYLDDEKCYQIQYELEVI